MTMPMIERQTSDSESCMQSLRRVGRQLTHIEPRIAPTNQVIIVIIIIIIGIINNRCHHHHDYHHHHHHGLKVDTHRAWHRLIIIIVMITYHQ